MTWGQLKILIAEIGATDATEVREIRLTGWELAEDVRAQLINRDQELWVYAIPPRARVR